MNRRLFLTSGISMIALSRMAKGLEDSQFFQGNHSGWSVPAILGISEVLSVPGLVSGRQVRNLGPLEPAVCARTGRLVRAEYVQAGDASI